MLFLDELAEFDRRVLESLREPLESRTVVISRARAQAQYPAAFQLIAAMNPCPCGYRGEAAGRCRCTPAQIAAYGARISGPLLDRIDLFIEVPRLQVTDVAGPHPAMLPRRDTAAYFAGRSGQRGARAGSGRCCAVAV